MPAALQSFEDSKYTSFFDYSTDRHNIMMSMADYYVAQQCVDKVLAAITPTQ